eukprot:TRINITY_DN4341_c0_g2_i1.p1 TRINITY_DN4341_c0_g2~~TRINITY_DN4341_c0_g2_i1.p1  ORF type:complete len:843 (-),score=156.46 TRINITY_DN4341_c0_g2_i1:67-2544(-)
MQQIQLFVQIEAARDTVDELGNLGVIQFRDLNPEVSAFQRTFVNEVKRYDEMLRKVRYFEEQVRKADITDDVLSGIQIEAFDASLSSKVMIDELESKFEECERELIQLNTNEETLNRNLNELVEMQFVLDRDAWFFDESDIQRAEMDETQLGGRPIDESIPLFEARPQRAIKLGHVTGVIPRDRVLAFERVLWRATRGNMYLKQTPVDDLVRDPHTGETIEKNVFIIFFQGDRVEQKIKKICETHAVNMYPCPSTIEERRQMKLQLITRLNELRMVISKTEQHSRRVKLRVAANLPQWSTQVIKEKAIFHTMNMFNYDVGYKCLIAEGWCPSTAIEPIQLALRRAAERSGAIVPSILSINKTHETPPTHFQTNKFTSSFQDLVDSYGMARYQEVNPGVFTIITFPFLFGVMFGDVGHGLFMAMFGLFLMIKESSLSKASNDEMFQMVFGGRYMIFMMGLFSIYAGFIYNEFFAIPMTIFQSPFSFPNVHTETAHLDQNKPAYLFGADPTWAGSENSLMYFNSLKMKLSVIMGVVQMTLGIFLSLLNAIHFRKPYNILFEFIPQMIFLMSTFGYMCVLIIFKWLINWPGGGAPETLQGNDAPSILNVMIAMFKSPGFTVAPEYHLYPGQGLVQLILLLLALVSVPIMLFVKPLLLKRDHERSAARLLQSSDKGYQNMEEEEEEEKKQVDHGDEHEHFEFGEELVHQGIHTIEFVLGAVSNTASYLRLWALSLAHSQLSVVFLEMVLITCLEMGELGYLQIVLIAVGFLIWASLTAVVLMGMESLSAFLHALRLHWVEFQNKFYMGDGYKFVPFSYAAIMSGEVILW